MSKQPRRQQRPSDNKSPVRSQRRQNSRRLWLIIAAVALMVILIITLCVRLFGSVDMTSSDRPSSHTSSTTGTAAGTSSSLPATSSSSSAKSTAQTSVKVTTTSATTAVSGHYVQPSGAAWNLKLVNPWNPLPANYAQTLVAYNGDTTKLFDSRAIDQLKALIKAGSPYNLRVASTYRSVELQTKLFEQEVKDVMATGKSRAEAEKLAATEVARPGTSEHNLGLAADLTYSGYSNLLPNMKNTEGYRWLIAHCADYGFILRFPENKQSLTNVTFEPWHYRYVGTDAAKVIMSRGITLEEYLRELGQ